MPSDPSFDALGSLEVTGCFVDEASEISPTAYAILNSRIRFKLDENNLIPKMLLTCNPSKAWLYSEFYKPSINGTLDNNKFFIQSLVTDNPHVSKHYIKQLQGLDMVNKKRLLYGDWTYSDDESNLFNMDKLNDIFTNTFITGSELFMSIDVARFGRDKSVICIWEGWRCIKIYTYAKNTLSELADEVNKYAEQFKVSRSNIVVDSDGVGGAIPDFIRGIKSFVNNSKALNNENYRNLKSQCYYDFADKVNKGLVYIANDNKEIKQSIISEFELVKQYDIDKDSKLAITPKDKIKGLLGRSPDLADALIMRSYFSFNKNKIVYFG